MQTKFFVVMEEYLILLTEYDIYRYKRYLKFNEKKKNTFINNYKLKYQNKKFRSDFEHLNYLYNYISDDEKKIIFNKDIKTSLYSKLSLNYFKKIFSQINKNDYLQKMQYFFNKVHLQGILLRDDNSSMSGSVELRVPFLDHKIVEFAAQVPDNLKK